MSDKWVNQYIGIARTQPTKTFHFDDFTPREIEVMGWVARGLTIGQISKKMLKPSGAHLSVHTTTDHLNSLYKKLRIDNRAELTRIALAQGLIALPTEESLKKLIEACCQFSDNTWKVFEQISIGKENWEGANTLRMTGGEYQFHKDKIYEALHNFTVDGIEEPGEEGSAAKATIAWVALKQKVGVLTGKASPQTETICTSTSDTADRNDRVHASSHNTQEQQLPSNKVLTSENAGRMDSPRKTTTPHNTSTRKSNKFDVTYKKGVDNDRFLTQILEWAKRHESPRLR